MTNHDNYSTKGKRLLILGGTSATYDLVKKAKEMGVYTIVTDDNPYRISKEIADDRALISTNDMEGLLSLIKEKAVDGVFCGPSEFNIRNLIKICQLAKLPCYATEEQWEQCANKDIFKNNCRRFGVDCTPEYEVSELTTDEELERLEYPVIVKPVDGCSSFGITVCDSKEMVKRAYEIAMDNSKCKRIIVEKYIENDGALFGVRYLVREGEAHPYLLIDTYITDPVHRTSLTSAFTITPSKYTDYYMENMDKQVRKMLKGIGIKNGTVFIQALPYKGKILFHEMGFRLSGGMIFKLTEPLKCINDMKMMIRYALGGPIYTDNEIQRVNIKNNQVGGQLMIPLNTGIIGEIKGIDIILKSKGVEDFIQYYQVGDIVKKEFIGTLAQHFGRFTLIKNSIEELFDIVEKIQNELIVTNKEGLKMNTMPFCIGRVTQ